MSVAWTEVSIRRGIPFFILVMHRARNLLAPDGGCDGFSVRGVRGQANGGIDHVVARSMLNILCNHGLISERRG
jgi:hypothetical protein